MSVARYMAAAAGGPNMAARAPALANQTKTAQRLHSAFHGLTGLGHGSLAGLKTESPAVVEMAGNGYGKFAKKPFSKSASIHLGRPSAGAGAMSGIHDTRSIRRPQLCRDKDLAKLL